MTPQARFERIETALYGLIEAQRINQQSVATLTESVNRYVDAADTRMKASEDFTTPLNESIVGVIESIGVLNLSVARYVDASDASMKRIEENLDSLIRVITAEHGNGKGQH